MRPHITLKKNLRFLVLAALTAGSGNLVASPDDDAPPGGGGDGGGRSSDALTSNFLPIPPTAGKGYGSYFPFSVDGNIAFNADVRLALEKLADDDPDADTLAYLNTHLGITRENYNQSVITLFIGTDEDGDGTCLTEGPTSMCVFETSGSHDLEINDDNILHAAWALALRAEDGVLTNGGTGTCYTDFTSTEVLPQFDELGNMTSVVFNIVGGVEGMPEISDGDGCMVGYGAPWLEFSEGLDCSTGSCEIIPIMMGQWDDM